MKPKRYVFTLELKLDVTPLYLEATVRFVPNPPQ